MTKELYISLEANFDTQIKALQLLRENLEREYCLEHSSIQAGTHYTIRTEDDVERVVWLSSISVDEGEDYRLLYFFYEEFDYNGTAMYKHLYLYEDKFEVLK